MRILLVSTYLLHAKTRFGGSRRIFNIAMDLERGHDLSVLCFDANAERGIWDGQEPFRRFLLLPREEPGRRRRRWTHCLDAGGLIAEQAGNLRAFLAGPAFDLVILAYAFAPNLLRRPEVAAARRVLYIEGDLVIGQVDAHRRAARGWARRLVKEIRYRQVLRFYRRSLAGVDAFLLSTRTEIEEVNRRFPGVPTARLPMGVETDALRFLPPPGDRGVAGFIGNFRHAPNLDAVRWYLERIHPRLAARHPEYRFALAGADLPADMAARAAEDPRILLLGPVEAVEDFYGRIAFLVNPIVSGKGVRTKVIEAAASGRLVASTPLGADGTAPLEVAVGEGPEEFAEACSRLILAGPGSEGVRVRNRALVEEHFSADAVRRLLLAPSLPPSSRRP